jgi:hypothetical protein
LGVEGQELLRVGLGLALKGL